MEERAELESFMLNVPKKAISKPFKIHDDV